MRHHVSVGVMSHVSVGGDAFDVNNSDSVNFGSSDLKVKTQRKQELTLEVTFWGLDGSTLSHGCGFEVLFRLQRVIRVAVRVSPG